MTTVIRSLADLQLLKEALRVAEGRGDLEACVGVPEVSVLTAGNATSELSNDDSAERAELAHVLMKHDLWLGYSPVKGWALLDRQDASYRNWDRSFVLLRDGSIDRLNREEFSQEPDGPWSLTWWKNIEGSMQLECGPIGPVLREVRRYIDKAEDVARNKAEDDSTRIGEPPFDSEIYRQLGLGFYEKWTVAKTEHYTRKLPARVDWLRSWAKKMSCGAVAQEPVWSRGCAAVRHLSDHGITHLWHFTDSRNLESIFREGGLYSWAGLDALGIGDVQLVSNDNSRSCDARLGRERFVRLSFIPNSWFFQRVRSDRRLVWLKFSLSALKLGEIKYSFGNAASEFVSLQDEIQSKEIDWAMVTQFSAPCSEEMGPTRYATLYPDQVADPALFRKISNGWNSEALIKDFLPIEFCDGVFDSRTGKSIRI
jgi:hypothetical protein